MGCLKSSAYTEQLVSGYVRQGLYGEGILKSNDISMLPTGDEASTTLVLFSLQSRLPSPSLYPLPPRQNWRMHLYINCNETISGSVLLWLLIFPLSV